MVGTPREIGFIGTGLMGAPMAANLARAGMTVTAWNRDAAKLAVLATDGVVPASTPAEAATGRDAVILMLSSGPVCDEILGAGGVLAAMRPGEFLIVMSSISVPESQAQAKRAAGLGIRYIDAPVSGGVVGATEARLAIMAGGAAEDVAAADPVFEAMGRAVHIGPAGTGQLAKLVNQLTVASTIVAVSEAILLAEAGGADPARVREALLGGFAQSRILAEHGARMIEGNFRAGGPAKYQIKDTAAARSLADGLGLDLPMLKLADGLFGDLVAHGGGDYDHSSLILELRRRNRLGLPESFPLAKQPVEAT